MKITKAELLKRLPEINLPREIDQPGRYISEHNRIKECRWHRRIGQAAMDLSPSSSSGSHDDFIGDAKFSKTDSVSVEIRLLDYRGRVLRKVQKGKRVKDTLKSKKASKKGHYLLIITNRGKKNYTPSHTYLSHNFEIDIYRLGLSS